MVQITSIEGNGQWLDGGSMFGNAPRALWQRWTEVDEQGRIPLACRSLLVQWNGLNILCEAGIGSFFEPKLAERFGVQNAGEHMLIKNLAAAGVKPNEIDYVILSHLHFDHAGGLLPTYQQMQQGQQGLVFEKAKFVVGEEAWERAQNPHFRDRASFIPELNKRLVESNRLVIVKNCEPPTELAEIISFFVSSGHTPGQMHTRLKGQTSDLIFAGDLIPGLSWVHLPITMGYDRYPEMLIEEKQKLYESYADQQVDIFFTHDPKWAKAKLSKNAKGQYTGTNLVESLTQFEF